MKTKHEVVEHLNQLVGVTRTRSPLTEAAAKPPKKLTGKKLDKQIEQFYYKHAQGTQINVMDIGKLYKDCRAAYEAGEDLEQAVIKAIAKYKAESAERTFIKKKALPEAKDRDKAEREFEKSSKEAEADHAKVGKAVLAAAEAIWKTVSDSEPKGGAYKGLVHTIEMKLKKDIADLLEGLAGE
jgi:tetratricopeptide (TPR) repeat protein